MTVTEVQRLRDALAYQALFEAGFDVKQVGDE